MQQAEDRENIFQRGSNPGRSEFDMWFNIKDDHMFKGIKKDHELIMNQTADFATNLAE